jgi:uridine phosphorylase
MTNMQKIEPSELIINKRGAIYHLDLRPEEIADTIITVGDPFRVEKVSRHFDSIEHQSHHREFITHTGYIGSSRISVVSTGIGPDNIDIVMNELDALVNIDFEQRMPADERKTLKIVRIGTSGSLQADIPVDSFVASTHGLGLDNLMHYYPFVNNDEESAILQSFRNQVHLNPNLSSPYVFGAGGILLAKLAEDCHVGITATCPGFYGPQGRNLRMGLSMPSLNTELTAFRLGNHRITNFEMETAALYGLSRCMGHQAMSMSAIVANRIAGQFSADADQVVDKLIRHVLERVV